MSESLITSPFLWASIVLLLIISAMAWKLRTVQLRLKDATIHDHTTHALEWPYNEQEASRMVKHCERYKEAISFLMLDGDHFRRIYDDHGPEAGQEAMSVLAQSVTNVIREVDIFGRYGSGKFIICLPSTELNGAVILAERIRQAVEDIKPRSYRSNFTISIGCAEKQSQENMNEVIKRANQALERARAAGGNRVAASKNHEAKSHKNAVWPNLRKSL
ncbi:GGDEF domain-containing protein [Hahella ganghwensis]|uniref:GGDEF domain-containing protein n=1 Tax=Hahella ganghwensis TaxID=286420 RepID=UPI00035DAA14|nr:GGDEF domain-containing protein [Hahella ganghwensis]